MDITKYKIIKKNIYIYKSVMDIIYFYSTHLNLVIYKKQDDCNITRNLMSW